MPSNIPTYTAPNGHIYTAGGANATCTVSVCPVELSIYGYRPSLPASSTLIALYALCLVIQIFLGWRYKTWGFMAAMVLGCIDEILGYVGRILLWQDPWGHAGFIMQIVLITIGPVFFSAAIYVLLYQITVYIALEASRFNPKYYYYGFIPCDLISLILQAIGGAMSSTSNGGSTTGVKIALAGLSFQVITLFVFAVLASDFAIRSRYAWKSSKFPTSFKVFVVFVTLATVLIYIRCCYRIYELHQGYSMTSSALRDQNLFSALESAPVIAAGYALVIGHPGPVFQERSLDIPEIELQER